MWDFHKFGDATAVIEEDGLNVTYKELEQEQERLASVIDRRCLIFIFCENSAGAIAGYAGCVNNKVVPVLLSSSLEGELRTNLMETYQPAYIWLPQSMVEEFSDVSCVYESLGYALLRTNYPGNYQLYPELALLLTTSGSTGSPKLVRQSYKNIEANTASIIEYLELDANQRSITTLPMNYTYGLSIINTHLMVGAEILTTKKGLMQKEFWAFFREQKATSFGGVPYTYEMLDRLRFTNKDYPDFQYMTQAGGKLTPELHKKFARYAQENNKKFIVMYGQCEATARMGYLPGDKAMEKCGSMGIAIPGGTFHLIDVDGNKIAEPNVTGELIYEGPNVTMGYAERIEDLALGDQRGGVLHTGDMAQFDQDGYYYIVGRKKRFLKIYGNRVNLDEIDRLVKGKFQNIDCASGGVDDHMYLFITDDSYTQDVKTFVAHTTGLNQVAFQVVVINEIPKNDAGKTLYKELEQYYQ